MKDQLPRLTAIELAECIHACREAGAENAGRALSKHCARLECDIEILESGYQLDHAVQLHERIEIHYYVDCYEAQLWTQDGNHKAMVGKGETIKAAMMALECKLRGVSLQMIRRL